MNDFYCFINYKRLQAVFILFIVTALSCLTFTVQAQEPELLIASAVSPENPYIQQPVQYTLRFWRRSHLQQGYFLRPDIPDAILLEDEISEVRRIKKDGLDYELLEQRYVLIAQKSGVIQLPEPVFSSREIFVKGKSLRLKVKPQPEAFAQENWLIAKSMTIEQNWLFPEQSLTVGDPVERTIIISGTGITGAQLPKLQLTANGLIVHNFFDNARHSVKNGEVSGQRILKFRYIANKPGHYSIPEIRLLWWNSQTGQIEKERIPGKRLLIEPATTLNSTTLNKQPGFVKSAEDFQGSWFYEMLSGVKNIARQQGYSILLVSLLTLIAVILAIKYKLYSKLYWLSRTVYQSKIHTVYWNYKLQRALLKACDQNDCHRVKRILLQWAKINFSGQSFSNLIALSEMTQNKSVIAVLSDIDQCLYGNAAIKKINIESKLCLVSFMRRAKKPDIIKSKPCQLPQLWSHCSK